MRTCGILSFIGAILLLVACESPKDKLKKNIAAEFAKTSGTFAVAFKDLNSGDEILINEHDLFHAASTMKTPVMIEVFKQANAGKLSLRDSILVKDEFKSIVDGSTYMLSASNDSYARIYDQVGVKMTLDSLVYYMITASSNLATNIVIDLVDAKNVTQSMRDLGANDIQVLRGVEDTKAFQAGLNNKVTAYDLMLIFEKLAKGEVVDKTSSDQMLGILGDQDLNDIIPAKLPAGTTVAHKTGWITGLHHDSGIVYPGNGNAYVLVLLSREMKDEEAGVEAMANVSRMIYDYATHEK